MVACQTDLNEVGVVADGVSAVEFEVGAPQMRSFSDGMTATVLQYAVYEVKGEGTNKTLTYLDALTAAGEDAETLVGGAANVKIELANNKKYAVIFWASAAVDGPYTFNPAAMTVTVNYDGAVCNDESRDAFYAYKEFEVKGAATLGVELRRPFAQLNVGATDLAAALKSRFKPVQSALKVKNACNVLNLVDGTATTTPEDEELTVTFAAAAVPTGETFPVDGNAYMAMSYVLVGKDKGSYDVEYTIKAEDGTEIKHTIGAVPMQANYRTNIYGKLLTSTTDINVEINPDYNEPDYSVYNVMVDGVSYDDFAVAVAKAMELNKPIEFVQNVTIDADETITVPAGKVLTLNLNGHTLSGVTDDADKNDDGTITSADNEVMFDVRGTMNVNKGRVTIKHVGDSYANFGWNACGEVFYVAFNGVLNVNNSHIENFGGVPMAYAIDLVNASATRCDEAGVHLNVESSVLKSSYIPVRVFNNGAGMNHVTIKNSTLEGTSRAFWVHVYTQADDASFFNSGKDTDGNGYKNETLNINIFNPTCNNIFKANSEDRLIEYGFTNEINPDVNGTLPILDGEGKARKGIGLGLDGIYYIFDEDGMIAFSELVNGGETFVGKTAKLVADIDLDGIDFYPIGYNNGDRKYFEGTFDGNNKTIKNLKRWDDVKSRRRSVGLFSQVMNATVKDLTMEDFVAAKYGYEVAVIAGEAVGDCTFENLTFKKGSVVGYNNDTAPVIGWANKGNFTLKNITVGSDVGVYSLWDSPDTALGGLIGTLENPSTVNIENATISCVLNAFNDVVANYQWYAYRHTGMVIGNMYETQTIDGRTLPNPAAAGVTCKNVTVNYGDWMNYHYCEFEANGVPSYADPGEWKFSRVEGQEWGRESNIDTDNCQHDTDESHNICLPLDQLFGGDKGVYGLREYAGVTVNYPASYRREVASVAALKDALGKGVSVILDTDIDLGSEILYVDKGQTLDLGGKTLTQSGGNRGIILKNGASLKNGVINHSGIVAAVRAWNIESIENVTINLETPASGTVTGIAVQQYSTVGAIKNVTVSGAGVTQAIEVPYQSTVNLIENVNVDNSAAANGVALVINGGKVVKAKDCTFKGNTYGVTMHLKGVFAVGLELENCKVEGTTASIYAWDEKGKSNTSGSLVLTYDAATQLVGPFVWDFEDECQSVVTLNRPQ